jgi:hypothetical protein
MTLSFAPERIECWPLERLKPYARNAKTHGADQVAKIAGSMAQFGWTMPVLVSGDGEVIAGHGRILAATQLGLAEAPVIVLDHLTEEQRKAYRLADNRLAESPWDEALLAGELQELAADDFDLSLIGFSDAELDQLLTLDVGRGESTDNLAAALSGLNCRAADSFAGSAFLDLRPSNLHAAHRHDAGLSGALRKARSGGADPPPWRAGRLLRDRDRRTEPDRSPVEVRRHGRP